jgi:hypothetical protein
VIAEALIDVEALMQGSGGPMVAPAGESRNSKRGSIAVANVKCIEYANSGTKVCYLKF